MTDESNELFDKALRHAITAGGLGRWAKADPRLARGFNKAASKQHERSDAALNAWASAACRNCEGE